MAHAHSNHAFRRSLTRVSLLALICALPLSSAFASMSNGLDTCTSGSAACSTLPFSISGTKYMELTAPSGATPQLNMFGNVNASASIYGNSINDIAAVHGRNTSTIGYAGSFIGNSAAASPWTGGLGLYVGGLVNVVSGGIVTQGAITNNPTSVAITGVTDVTPQIFVNGDNHTGGGIAVSDDGGFFDYNDGWVTFIGSGLRVQGNGLGTEGSFRVKGHAQIDSTITDAFLTVGATQSDFPTGWFGIHTFDLYANGTIAVGNNGISAQINNTSANFNYNVFANGYFHNSDARLKTNIQTAPGLEMVEKLHGVTYNWKKDKAHSAGVIAQEVEKVMPSAVHTDDKGMKTVEYDQLMAPMIEAIKELKALNDKQAVEIADIKIKMGNK